MNNSTSIVGEEGFGPWYTLLIRSILYKCVVVKVGDSILFLQDVWKFSLAKRANDDCGREG